MTTHILPRVCRWCGVDRHDLIDLVRSDVPPAQAVGRQRLDACPVCREDLAAAEGELTMRRYESGALAV